MTKQEARQKTKQEARQERVNKAKTHVDHLVEFHRASVAVPLAVRLIAGLSLIKFMLFLVTGLVVGRFIDHEGARFIQRLALDLHIDPDGARLSQLLNWVSGIDVAKLQFLDVVCFSYATLYLIQALGLWYDRYWAEWLTLVMALLFVPYEIFEVIRHHQPLTIILLVLNLAVVAYLIHHVRQKRQQKKLARESATHSA